MRIEPLQESHREEWDKIVRESDHGWLFHLYEWVTEVNEGVKGYRSVSFVICGEQGETLGICPLFYGERRYAPGLVRRSLSSGASAGGGVIPKPGLQESEEEKIRGLAFRHIDELAQRYRADYVEIRLSPLGFSLEPSSERHPLIPYGFADTSSKTYILNLEKSDEELWKVLKGECRTAIRKAAKHVEIRHVPEHQATEEYYRLHKQTYTRTGATPHPFAYFEAIRRNGWGNLFFAFYRGKLIGAVNVALFKGRGLYWMSASDSAYGSLSANNLLQWSAIKWARANGARWYEVGELDAQTSDPKLQGIQRFKKSFGGDVYPYYKGVKEYHPRKLRFLQWLRHGRNMILPKNIPTV